MEERIKFWKKSVALRTAATPTAHATARRDVVNAFSVETTPSAQPVDMAVPCANTGDSQDGRNPEVKGTDQVQSGRALMGTSADLPGTTQTIV